MIPVLTKEQAYKLDKDTIKSGYLSQEELMDNAGKAIAQFFCEKIDNPFNQKVVVVCGKGNNGGDGVIAHSYLKKYNVLSKIVFTEEKHGHSKLLREYKISKTEYSVYNNKTKFDKYDWIIDGIFGIGLSRRVNEKYIGIIKNINSNNQIISIDIASGFSSNGNKYNYAISSEYVITFGYSKLGHYLNSTNNLNIVDIGFKVLQSNNIQLITMEDISNLLKPKKIKENIHKYSKGRVHIIAGSDVYPGAGILSAKAAEKSGSGYVSIYFKINNMNLISNIQSLMPNIIIMHEELRKMTQYENPFKPFDSKILFGPGLVEKQKSELFGSIDILDSGGFLCFDDINDFPQDVIITPHFGEFKGIFKLGDNIVLDISLIESIQQKIANRIIVLKLFNTFIVTKDMIYIMDKGPSILATAGTGDVLSGILVSLLSQGYSRLEASILGTYLHAEAANYYMNNISKDGMTASDLIDCIPYAFNNLREDSVN